MLKTLATILYNVTSRNPPVIQLGRWCHPNYSKSCNLDIKSHLANIDNSSNDTGLCKTRRRSSLYPKQTPKRQTSSS